MLIVVSFCWLKIYLNVLNLHYSCFAWHSFEFNRVIKEIMIVHDRIFDRNIN